MYNITSKVVSLFLDPLTLALLVLVGAWFVRRRWSKVFLGIYVTAVVFLLVMGCPTTARWLSSSLENQYPDKPAEVFPTAQAIVVLGGSLNMPSEAHQASGLTNSSDRLLLALRLFKAGKAPLVILSGGNSPLLVNVPKRSEAEEMRALLEEWGVPASSILVEGGSINTHENALFSHQLLSQRGIGRIILVTSALHMPRAAATFRKLGFDVVAAPADFRTGWEEQISIFNWFPATGELLGSSDALHEWLGLWVYRIHGWA